MKKLSYVLCGAAVAALCSCAGSSTANQWPARTKNQNIFFAENIPNYDVNSMHEAIWAKNPNAKVLSIDITETNNARVATTNQATGPITSTKHYYLNKSGSTWSLK